LQNAGLTIIRFENDQLKDNLDGVLETIKSYLHEASPLLSKEGRPRSGRGGYQRTAKRTFFVEVTNHPGCASKERDYLLVAQPPLLGKEGIDRDQSNGLQIDHRDKFTTS